VQRSRTDKFAEEKELEDDDDEEDDDEEEGFEVSE